MFSITTSASSDFSPELISVLAKWVLNDRDGHGAVRSLHVTKTTADYRGWCTSKGVITVRVGGPEWFPREMKYPGMPTAPEYTAADRVEAFVAIFAHEVEHARQFQRRRVWDATYGRQPHISPTLRPKISEINAEKAALRTLARFRVVRESLGLEAVHARVAEKHAVLVQRTERAAARRAEKRRFEESDEAKRAQLLASIAAWETKAKRAATYLKKYTRRLAAHDRRVAAKNGVV